jgi:hypothetical protein
MHLQHIRLLFYPYSLQKPGSIANVSKRPFRKLLSLKSGFDMPLEAAKGQS